MIWLSNNHVCCCRAEDAHKVLKKTLHSSTGGLDSVIESIDWMLRGQAREVRGSLEKDRTTLVRGSLEKDRNTSVVQVHDLWLFDKDKHIASNKCIGILHKSFKKINEGKMTPACNDGWWNIFYGLPCPHQIH